MINYAKNKNDVIIHKWNDDLYLSMYHKRGSLSSDPSIPDIIEQLKISCIGDIMYRTVRVMYPWTTQHPGVLFYDVYNRISYTKYCVKGVYIYQKINLIMYNVLIFVQEMVLLHGRLMMYILLKMYMVIIIIII